MALYYGLKIGEGDQTVKTVFKFAFSLLAGLHFRANILLLIPFIIFWWILRQQFSMLQILKKLGIIFLVLSLFIVPWSIRNYRIFHNFIPITYGAANPTFEGTYRGEGFPTNEEMVELNDGFDAEQLIRDIHPELYTEDGELINPGLKQYESVLRVGQIAKHRMRVWFMLRPKSFIKSYLYLKPKWIINWVWYQDELLNITHEMSCRLRQINLLICIISIGLSFWLRQHRKIICFLALTYTINLFIVASGFPIDRYAQAIMPYRIIQAAIGCHCIWVFIQRYILHRKTSEESIISL